MKKKWVYRIYSSDGMRRNLLIMKLTCVFILFGCISVSATVFPQRNTVTMNVHNYTIQQVISEIEAQTDYHFFYDVSCIDTKKRVSVQSDTEDILIVLNNLFEDEHLTYKVIDKDIVIKSESRSAQGVSQEKKKTIFGNIVDEAGNPVVGVTVFVKGTTTGTISDVNGHYILKNVLPSNTVVFSFIGLKTHEIVANDITEYNVVLNSDVKVVSDVVVTALGITRQEKSLGYSVSKVSGDEMDVVKSINAVNSLSGKVAGVDIVQANTGVGGSSKVTIRGNSKITGSNQPLYVIDGIPMDNDNIGEAGQYGGQDLGDGISSINPDDIETMSVLKGPAAAALYGTRASNGVIIITTKSWKKSGANKFNIDVTSNFTLDNVVGQYKDVQYIYGQGIGTPPKDIGDATGMWSWGAKMDPDLKFISFDGKYRDYGVKKDNIKSFFNTGSTFENTIAFSGGNENANFRFSASDVRMNDIVPNSGLNRNSFNLRGTMKMWDKLSLDAKINYIHEKVDNRPYLGYSGANTALALIGLPANFDQSWLKESRVDEDGHYVYWNSSTRILNPYYSLYEMENKSIKNRVLGYFSLNYAFTDWLNLRVKAGIDTYSYLYYNFSPTTTPLAEWGEMRQLNSRTTEINSEFLLTAKKDFNEHLNLSGSIGGNIMNHDSQTTDVLGKGEVSDQLVSINNYNEFSLQYQHPEKQINSLYALLNLGYKEFLYFDVTARNDWSSTLPVANNSYFYSSVTSAFIFTNAFDNLKSKFMSFGKLRASYAEVGGDTDPYHLNRTYSNFPYTMNGSQLTTENTIIMPNPSLKPSRTKGYEFGLDTKLLNWRIGLDLTYYNQSTFDEIITLPISSASAYDYAYINAGEINNRGLEIMMNIVPIKTKDLRWDLTFNYASNTNKVVKLHPDAKIQEISRADWISSYIQAAEGHSYGDIVGYDFKRAPNGNPIVDSKGQPVRSDEQVVIGNGQYKFTGGITNTIAYKGLTLRMLIDTKFGADILSMTNMKMYQYGTQIKTLEGREGWNMSENERYKQGVSIDDWTPTGGYVADAVVEVTDAEGNISYQPNTTFVNPREYFSNLANKQIMSPFIYDASYIKFREISLSYRLNGDWLKSLKVIKGAIVSLTGRNLWVIWSKVPNIDPESTYSVSNGQGYEYGSLPQRRNIGVNLKFNF